MDQQTWRAKGLCATLDIETADKIFYVGRGQTSKRAKEFCKNCPVKKQCLAFAVLHNEVGIWAGYTDEERYELRNFSFSQVSSVVLEVRNTDEWLPSYLFIQSSVMQEDHQLFEPEIPPQSLESGYLQPDPRFLSASMVQDALALAEELLAAL